MGTEITTVEQAVAMFVSRHDPANPLGTWTQIDRLEQMARRGQDATPFTAAELSEIAARVTRALTTEPAATEPTYTVEVEGQVVAGSADRDTAVNLYNATVWDLMVRRGETTTVRLNAGGVNVASYPEETRRRETMRTPYPCGCSSHNHTTVQDRDRCARGEVPCSEATHPWPPLPAGCGIYVRQTCPHCGLTRMVVTRGDAHAPRPFLRHGTRHRPGNPAGEPHAS